MTWRLVVIGVLTVAATFVGTVIWGRAVVQERVALVYRVGNPAGVERLEAIDVGGLKQWIHIRGQDRRNPVLLYLHGGPGAPKLGSQDALQRAWEDYFTVVHWDQRQTGKSYYSMDEIGDTMRLERIVADIDDVVQHLRRTLNKDKIILLGHSWGSTIGMHYVKQHPEFIHAYIGVAQGVSRMENERRMFARVEELATARGDTAVLARLKTMAPFPNPDHPDVSYVENENGRYLRNQLNRMAGEAYSRYSTTKEAADVVAFDKFISPLITWRDLYKARFGGKIAQYDPDQRYKLIDDFMAEDLPNQIGSKFQVPIFFFTGAHDNHNSHDMTRAWLDQIEAPYKELVWFEEAAHAVPTDQPGKFLVALVDKVRPLAAAELELSAPQAPAARSQDAQ